MFHLKVKCSKNSPINKYNHKTITTQNIISYSNQKIKAKIKILLQLTRYLKKLQQLSNNNNNYLSHHNNSINLIMEQTDNQRNRMILS